MDVLLAPLEDVLDLLDDLGQSPVQPRKPETVLEWVHMGVPAFRLPEDVRGSFMNRVT